MTVRHHEGTNIYNKNNKVIAAEAPSSGSAREIQARALALAARRLNDAKALMDSNPKSKDYQMQLGEALRYNQQIWTYFQVGLTDPENPLPTDLKGNLLSLSIYVDKTSFQLAARYAPELIDSLININRMIGAGLSKNPPADAYAPAAPDTRDIPMSLTTSA